MTYSELTHYFEHTLENNPRNCTVTMVVQTWKKVHEALQAIKGVQICDPNQLAIDYLKRCFVIKSQLEWWVSNCASCGAADDFTKVARQSVFLVEEECTGERIVEWICTRSFNEIVDYAFLEDNKCPYWDGTV